MNTTANIEYSDKEEYYRKLKERRKKHLKKVNNFRNQYWRPCMHEQCSECHGTGVKENGPACIHMISCPCPKCSPQC